MPKQRVEYRVVDARGRDASSWLLHSQEAAERLLAERCRHPNSGPFRVERRTVTTSEWETVENGGDDAADLIERTAKENTA